MITAALPTFAATIPHPDHGVWRNIYGYRCDRLPIPPPPWWGSLWWAPKPLYEFTLAIRDPLTYVGADGREYQPDRRYQTDKGTIPRPLQVLMPSDLFERSFLLHDSGYAFGGLWITGAFVVMTRAAVDALLREMILAEGGTEVQAWMVYAAVRTFGFGGWRKGDQTAS